MAASTDISLRQQIIYSVYIRNHTPEGTFRALIPDLPRIRALGTDIIWLMPIHPVGEQGKKGSLGCPYANRDYRSVNPEYGTMDDFRALVSSIHQHGMKCIIDVVYNHTSPDSVLASSRPEFFYRKPDGKMGNKTAEWTDVIDLDYNVPELWDYQMETLKIWAGIVDGFRCDVASCVPVEFWKRARAEVEKIRPGCIWLGETVYTTFNRMNRVFGYYAGTDAEMFEAFDIEYDYDIRESFDKFISGKAPLSLWTELLNHQEVSFPENYIKLRCLENHDRPRAASLFPDDLCLDNAVAMLFFLKGTIMLYAGQEFCCTETPSLFEKDVFPRSGRNISCDLEKMARLRKEYLEEDDYFFASADDENSIAVIIRDNGKNRKIGIFSLKGKEADVNLCFPDGEDVQVKDGCYTDLINGDKVQIHNGALHCSGKPVIISL
ncbi:MAG: alpha-amylase family glycosyl hydrolase [Eubacteriales bacterium]|nr:alpha-amylase family glycosyl hydrolase [Eubacteriales bacterium]